ncbi:MAG: hypothetical protein ACT4QB_15895 [Gammaproteobacteria bacterium]
MSKLITTITVGAVSALIGFAAMAEHEGGAEKQASSPNTGTGFTGPRGDMDESRWIQERADREFVIAAQECATLKSSSSNQFDPCMQEAEATRQSTSRSAGGETLAANQGSGQHKSTGIIDTVTDKVAEVTKAVTENLGFGSTEKTGQHGASGQSSQGALPQHGQMSGQGGQSAQHASTAGHGRYMPGHGVLDPHTYALTMANREHSIKHQECETIKRADPQGYEHCLEQADAAGEAALNAVKQGG